MNPTSARTSTLPDKSQPTAFRDLTFDRQRAYMVAEIIRLRDTLFGPAALIAQIKANPDPNMVHNLFVSNCQTNKIIFEQLFRYVDAMATADASMRWLGCLGPVAPFAPEQPNCPCDPKLCSCLGKLKQMDLVALIKSQHKLDWQPFLDYVETSRAAGRLGDQSASQLRLAMQHMLDTYNNDFLSMIAQLLECVIFPHHDLALLRNEQNFYKLLDEVKPLPGNVLQALQKDSNPASLSEAQLEELRKLGKKLRDSIASMARTRGNDMFAQAAKESGVQAQKLLREAEMEWMYTTMQGGIATIASLANVAALALQQKRYDYAVGIARKALMDCDRIGDEAGDIKTLRWAVTEAFRTGKLPDVPLQSRAQLTQKECDSMQKLRWKLLCRQAKAHIALCYEALSGWGLMSSHNLEQASRHKASAKECYLKASKVSNAPSTPMSEVVELEEAFRKRLDRHLSSIK